LDKLDKSPEDGVYIEDNFRGDAASMVSGITPIRPRSTLGYDDYDMNNPELSQ